MSIHEAAEDGREEELQKLIQRNIQAVNEEDEYGETPLHLACMAGHPNCVKLLLHNGAQVRFTLLPPLLFLFGQQPPHFVQSSSTSTSSVSLFQR